MVAFGTNEDERAEYLVVAARGSESEQACVVEDEEEQGLCLKPPPWG